ncbi:MAG TPA: ParB/RepB/Spo0J family partition protein [Gammaproteobacteria bacterium]|nr:ParB/RepB/Spo0J family partition protein [Gammaproteobacteria bacterium]
MATKKRGLGRGLDALLGGAVSASATNQANKKEDGVLKVLPVDVIQRGRYQPRVDMHPESLEELADSIRAQGVVQPIVVRPISASKYEIIAGERRWRAAQMAGLQEIPTVIRDVSDRATIAMALIENIQREDLNPMEEAHALKRLIDEFEMTQQQAAEAVGRSRTGVTNLLRLLELTETVKQMVVAGELEMGHARALLALKDGSQLEAAKLVATKGMSVRETERLVRKLLGDDASKAKKVRPRMDPDIRRLQDNLSDKLGARVQIQHGSAGKGKLVIHYNSSDELDGILDHFS